MKLLRLAPLLLLVNAGCDGCARVSPPAPERALARASAGPTTAVASAGAPALGQRELTWQLESAALGPMHVVLSVPPDAAGPVPVLIALHGRGEAFKGVERGARGWLDDYWLGKAVSRLQQPPLSAEDFLGFVSAERLRQINASLARRSYAGLIVACPYTPDILAGDRRFELALPLSRFVVDELLPRIERELGRGQSPLRVGIDGVSLGGRAALLVAFERPEAFSAVGSLQAAFDRAEIPELTRRAAAARRKNPALAIRLVTSEDDFFRGAIVGISKSFGQAGVEHELAVLPGPHDYAFNRGPGAYEMLWWHDRTLAAPSLELGGTQHVEQRADAGQ